MDQKELERTIRRRIGRTVIATFGEHRETVLVVSADLDGFICRIVTPRPEDAATEFWIAYTEVISVTEPEEGSA